MPAGGRLATLMVLMTGRHYKRQTPEQSADFARKAVEQNVREVRPLVWVQVMHDLNPPFWNPAPKNLNRLQATMFRDSRRQTKSVFPSCFERRWSESISVSSSLPEG
jgi:hypothetical protein